MSFNIAKGLDRRPVAACTKEDPACTDRPILGCNNTQGKPIVEMALGEDKISLSDNCLKVSGTDYGIVKAADRLLLQWYGIMLRK